MIQGGYMGKYLFVDLTKKEIEIRPMNEEYERLFIGGPTLGARMLWDLMEKGIPALAPESVCGFVAGPLTGTSAPVSGRCTFVSKSPVTEGFNDANTGGTIGPQIKKAGFDAVFITGKAEKPVYLLITDNSCEILDASHLWGVDYVESEKILMKELEETRGLKVKCAGIGNAGEALGHIAAVMNDGHRCAARGGPGAVMGSKNLKMIAVRGTQKVPVADMDKIREITKASTQPIRDGEIVNFQTYGTTGYTDACLFANDAGIKNWTGVGEEFYTEDEAKNLNCYPTDNITVRKRYACYACPIGCGSEFDLKDSKYPFKETTRPEYESAGSLGSMLLNKNTETLLYSNELCNRYGMDTISAGATVAWVMEAYEKGELTKDDLDGIEAEWGNEDAIIALMHKMGKAEGCGKILVNGSYYAAKYWGKGEDCLVVYSGIEPGIHDPRLLPGFARTYQYDPTPGRHCKGGYAYAELEDLYDYSDTGRIDLEMTSYQEFENAAGFCMFGSGEAGMATTVDHYVAATALPFDNEELLVEFGKRSFAMRAAFNIREGIKKEDYTYSERLLGIPPLESGPSAGVTVDGKRIADNFFREMGWNLDTYTPPKDLLLSLGGMEDVAEVIA